MSDHVVPLKTYVKVWLALMVLLVITVFASMIHIGALGNIALAMTIAVAKMTLIILFFMHVKYSSKLTQAFAASGFLWLLIMLFFFLADYFTRAEYNPWQ